MGKPPDSSTCARCGAAFTCGVVPGRQQCWCAALPRLQTRFDHETCLCPACLKSALENDTKDFPDAGTAYSPGRQR